MNIKNLFFSLLAAVVFMAGCKKTDVQSTTRLFRPVLAGSLVADSNAIQVGWTNIKAASSYTLQISRDTFRTIDVTMQVDTNAVLVKNLKWDQLYQLQVRANATDTALDSRFSNLGAIKTPKFPTILNSPSLSDVTDEAIRVSWTNTGATVTSIKVLKTDSTLVRDVPLTATDVANNFKIISGLTGNTTYIILIYSGGTLRGYDTYTTKAPLTGTIIDLRNITDRPSVLSDTLPLIDAGATVLLKRGFTYNIASTVLLSKAVTITSGSDLTVTDPAILYFTSNFNFAANSSIDFVDFKDLVMRSDNYTSRYVFNTTNSANVGRISFENCKIEIFRGITRLQSGTTTVSNYNVNNCVLDSLSGYGVITVDNVTCKADNISIKNTTMYKVEKVVTSRQNSTSVIIDQCTLNEGPLAGNYLIDYSTAGTNTVTNGIKVSNCIFGIAKNFGTGVRGIRVGSGTIDASNNYATSDYTLSASTPNAIPNLITYTKTSYALWQDPINGNFKIIDASFPAKTTAGDPRWR